MNIINQVLEAFSQVFIQKALLSGIFIAVSASILGVFLVLKNMSLIGDGLAHVSFAAIAIGLLFSNEPLTFAIPLVILASFLVLKLKESAKINEDSTIGMLSSFSMAVGIIIASVAKGFNVDLFSYLFGSILFITNSELIISILVSIFIIIVVLIFYEDLFAVSFDENFAKVNGINVKRIDYLLSLLTSITIILGIRIVGTLLISSLIVFPSITALQLKKGFKLTLLYSALFSVLSLIIGIIFSYIINIPSGASIVIANACFMLITMFWGKLKA